MELASWLCGVGLAGWSVGGACGACGGWGWVEQEAAERRTCGPSPCVVLLQHQSNPTPADENESIDHSSEPTAIDSAACSRAQARPRSAARMRLRTPPHQSKCNLNDERDGESPPCSAFERRPAVFWRPILFARDRHLGSQGGALFLDDSPVRSINPWIKRVFNKTLDPLTPSNH